MKLPGVPVARPYTVTEDRTLHYDDDVLITRTGAETWCEIPPVPFSFRRQDERLALGQQALLALGSLREGRVRFKTVLEPTDPAAIAEIRDQRARATGKPAPGWPGYLRAEQRAARDAQEYAKHVYLGVSLGPRSPVAQVRSSWRREPLSPISSREVDKWAAKARAKRELLARGGYHARPVTSAQMRALRGHALWRSTGPLPPSASGRKVWGRGHVADEFGDVTLTPLPGCVRVETPAGTCHTAAFVASVFPMSLNRDAEPWAAWPDWLDSVRVETDLLLDLIPAPKAGRDIQRLYDLAVDQRRDAAKAGHDLPIEVEEMLELGRSLQYDIATEGVPYVYGWVRFRVDAPNPEGIAEAYESLAQHMRRMRIDVVWPKGMDQAKLVEEGIPGSDVRLRSFRQRWKLEMIARALPHAASGLGDGTSALCGVTTGRQRGNVRWSPHTCMSMRDAEGKLAPQPPGTLLIGNSRAGKSSALGQMITDQTMQRHPTVGVDPGEMLGRLASHPLLAGLIAVRSLVASDSVGMVDPLSDRIIPSPQASTDEHAYRVALARVVAAREQLTRESLHVLLWRQYNQRPDAETAVLRTLHETAPKPGASLPRLVRALLAGDSDARWIGEHLRFLAGDPDLAVAFGERAPGPVDRLEATTTILTMPGIVLPEAGKPMAEWGPAEQGGAFTMTLGLAYARRLLWQTGDRLGCLVVDEAHVPLSTPAGRRAIGLALKQGGKLGKATILATHGATEVPPELLAQCSTRFLFRALADDDVTAALRAGGIEDSPHNRDQLRTLANGECIAVLPDNVRDRMQWDRDWVPGLAHTLTTDPTAALTLAGLG